MENSNGNSGKEEVSEGESNENGPSYCGYYDLTNVDHKSFYDGREVCKTVYNAQRMKKDPLLLPKRRQLHEYFETGNIEIFLEIKENRKRNTFFLINFTVKSPYIAPEDKQAKIAYFFHYLKNNDYDGRYDGLINKQINEYNTKIVPHLIEQRKKKAVFSLKLNDYKMKRNKVSLLAHSQRGSISLPSDVASTVFDLDLMLKVPEIPQE